MANVHAALWAYWEQHKQQLCAQRLTSTTDPNHVPAKTESVLKATNDVLTQLVGVKQPEFSERSVPALLTWDTIEDLAPEVREDVAAEMNYFAQPEQYNIFGRTVSVGHVVRGEKNIRAYVKAFASNYDKTYADLATTGDDLAALDAKATAQRFKMHALPAFGFPILGAYLGHYIGSPEAGLAVGMAAAYRWSFSLYLIKRRLRSYRNGDECWQSHSSGHGQFKECRAPILPESEQLDLRGSFFAHANFEIRPEAYHALWTDQPNAYAELRRSCMIASASCPTEEETAWTEDLGIRNTPGLSVFGAVATKMLRSHLEFKHTWHRVQTQLMIALVHETETGEPLLITRLLFRLSPLEDGKKKPKPKTELQERPTATGDWAPAR